MLKKVWNIISIMLVCVLVALAILLAGVRLFGVQPYTVLSGSMSPVYPTGALIYVKPALAQQVNVGDPITFRLADGAVVATHRVINIDNENGCFYTKGDANEAPDGQPVYFDQLIGMPVFSIPLLGYLASFISRPPGLYIGATLVVGVLVLSLLSGLLRKADQRSSRETVGEADNGKLSIKAGSAFKYAPQSKPLRNCKE